ncbi:MAG: 6-carboxytetrahydropterin synthase [Gemmatimonadaceae bacterium]|nr:6-carboxytetrahydropterin synthase [Gemmatimonadaceae bacterium]
MRFAAAHRYRRPEWDDATNARVFGACANPHFHGHSYVCDVTVSGPVDGTTGFVVDLGALDAALEREVRARYDHRNLNLECPEFADGALIPTGEVLASVIAERVQRALSTDGHAATVWRVVVAEDDTLWSTWEATA